MNILVTVKSADAQNIKSRQIQEEVNGKMGPKCKRVEGNIAVSLG